MFVIRREPHNPILSPLRERPWEARATFNPSVVKTEDGPSAGLGAGWHLWYRALGNADVLQSPHQGLSSIGHAFSEDGVHFHSRTQVLAPDAPFDQFGCEDPRVTYFEGKYYCFYTALGGYPFGPGNIKVGVAVGDSPEHFSERHLVTPFNAKAATLFPERVDGDVLLLLTAHTDWTEEYPRPTIALARAKRVEDFYDENYWNAWHAELPKHAIPDLRRTDRDHIEVGATPILTEKGWLLIYSYITDYYDEHRRVFSVEAALLDRNDPQKLISRSYPFLIPQEIYEEYGFVPNIVFPSGATVDGDTLELWYGAADTVCAKASVRLADLLRHLDPEGPARTFTREKENPILVPHGTGFESRDVFNPAAVDLDGSVHILYRAMDATNTSTIGLAKSKDGVHIDERLPEPIYVPRADFEKKKGAPDGNSGCEDPRAVVIGDRLYLTYTAYDGVHAPRGAVSSIALDDFRAKRFDAWSTPALLTPDNIDDKDLALLPEKIGGNFLLYHRINNQICADLLPDLEAGKRISRCIEILPPRHGMWDGAKVGVAAPPIKVDAGYLMIYHGVSEGGATYRLGAILLDHDGITLLARTADPLFEPIEPYEKTGDVPNVVFACGAVVRPSATLGTSGDTLYLYYGGGDHVVGVATASLSHIVRALT